VDADTREAFLRLLRKLWLKKQSLIGFFGRKFNSYENGFFVGMAIKQGEKMLILKNPEVKQQ
jgi:hypothetical protein